MKRLRLECNAVLRHSGHKETSACERLLRVAKHKPIAKGKGARWWLFVAQRAVKQRRDESVAFVRFIVANETMEESVQFDSVRLSWVQLQFVVASESTYQNISATKNGLKFLKVFFNKFYYAKTKTKSNTRKRKKKHRRVNENLKKHTHIDNIEYCNAQRNVAQTRTDTHSYLWN